MHLSCIREMHCCSLATSVVMRLYFGSFLLNKAMRALIGGIPCGGFKSELPDAAEKCAAAKMAMGLS